MAEINYQDHGGTVQTIKKEELENIHIYFSDGNLLIYVNYKLAFGIPNTTKVFEIEINQ